MFSSKSSEDMTPSCTAFQTSQFPKNGTGLDSLQCGLLILSEGGVCLETSAPLTLMVVDNKAPVCAESWWWLAIGLRLRRLDLADHTVDGHVRAILHYQHQNRIGSSRC